MMRVSYRKNTKGAALVTALIFSFALMVIMAALAYNMMISKSAIDTLVDDEINANIDNGYLDGLALSQNIDETVGQLRFVTTVNSETAGFYTKNTNGALYQAEPYLISHYITHNFINNGITEYTKNILFNSLPSDTMTQYSEDVYPINVPFVNVDGMTGDLAAYKLSSGSTVLDTERGFIGTIEKNSGDLNITASGTATTVGVPNDLSTADYKFSVGWNLKDGLWSVFLAAYDTSKAYTSSTTLRNLVDNSGQAQTDLNNWKGIASLPSGSSIPSGSVILTKWSHDADDEAPKPVILRKREVTEGSGTYTLEVYDTTYNSGTGVYTAGTPATTTATSNDFDVTKVFMVIPDNAFTLDKLDAKRPLIFYEDGSITKAIQFNVHGAGNITTLGDLSPVMSAEPVLVRKNATQMYLIYSGGASTYYAHTYSPGVLDVNAITPIQSVSGTIDKLIPKFGVLFIVTSSYIYVDDFDTATSGLINRITAPDSDYQFMRDDDGEIFAIKSGLSCTLAGDCNNNDKLYIRDEGSCSSYTGGCAAIDELNNISPYLGMVYKNDEH